MNAIECEKDIPSTSFLVQDDLLFGNAQPTALQDLRASLPARAVVDKLLFAYFNAKHNQTRQYIQTHLRLIITEQKQLSSIVQSF